MYEQKYHVQNVANGKVQLMLDVLEEELVKYLNAVRTAKAVLADADIQDEHISVSEQEKSSSATAIAKEHISKNLT